MSDPHVIDIEPTPETVLPVYVVVDQSSSMHAAAGVLNAQLASMFDAIRLQPMAAAGIRLSIIGFSDVATCYLTLADVRDLTGVAPFLPRGSTSYRAAFAELEERLAIDIAELKRSGHGVRRPVVFLLTDGHPNDDDWRESLATVVGTWGPLIVAFGIGEVDGSALAEIVGSDGYAFTASPGLELGSALSTFVNGLTASIVHSSATYSRFSGDVVIEMPNGFETVESGQALEHDDADDEHDGTGRRQ